jgi:hypothetical protein
MPNPIRFILYLFEFNIERIQVKPNDMKLVYFIISLDFLLIIVFPSKMKHYLKN